MARKGTTKQPNSPYYIPTEEIIRALRETRGLVSPAADLLHCTPQAIYDRIKEVKKVRQVLDEYRGRLIDRAEQGLAHHVDQEAPWAIGMVLKSIGKDRGYIEATPGSVNQDESVGAPTKLSLPAIAIAPSFFDVYRDIIAHNHVEYVLKGGRGSTKSSFASEAIIELLVNNPDWHVLATRQVQNTLRDSVYSQLQWAISYLGVEDKFKMTTSPLEITYIPTGQKIYFRGADDPVKIKSIKPPFGFINILWFEELDQFHGPAAIRSIEQSAIRGGDKAYIFKTYNPPKTASNWVNKYVMIPKPSQYQHTSDYTTVPPEWLGRTFIEEAEHLKEVNPSAYSHEYLGEIIGSGGVVFENLEIRTITDEEIATFDRVYEGLDWGYALDPLHWGRLHYDAGREIIYIFDEFRAHKMQNRQLYEALVNEKGCTPAQMIIADSAEPKSIADLREYGLNVRGAEKGPDSVRYSMRWLENRAKIVIDPQRCPHSAEEFLNYEFVVTKDGEFVSEYPDLDNHAIDQVRYATNLVWRQRGR